MAEHWAVAKLEDVRARLRALEETDTRSDWRKHRAKAKTRIALLEEEARYRRHLPAEPDPDSPF